MDRHRPGEAADERLRDAADRLYAARRAFLREEFEDYVADTYYYTADGGYYCWPAQTDGYFEGFTDATDGEQRVLDDLSGAGLEVVGVGASRIACRWPDLLGADVVVKFGRCGMGDGYGAGRQKNLVEAQVSRRTDDGGDRPIVPCTYCDPAGEYALYPLAEPVGEADLEEPAVGDLAARVDDALPRLREDELRDPANYGRLDGELRLLDYCEFDDVTYPLGVPAHVDADSVLRAVDECRRRGEKLDVAEPGTMVTPSIASGTD